MVRNVHDRRMYVLQKEGGITMAYYRTCEWCGAHLDPQETCECREDGIEKAPGMAVPLGQTEKYLYGYYNRELEEMQWGNTAV